MIYSLLLMIASGLPLSTISSFHHNNNIQRKRIKNRQLPSISTTRLKVEHDSTPSSNKGVWYSDSNLSRSSPHSWSISATNSLFLISQEKKGIVHLSDKGDDTGSIESLYLTYDQVVNIIGKELLGKLGDRDDIRDDSNLTLVWIGEHFRKQYFALNLPFDFSPANLGAQSGRTEGNRITVGLPSLLDGISKVITNDGARGLRPYILSLREFGDRLPFSHSAIHATANGLLEFHKSHRFCSQCGSPTLLQKAGASRICSNNKSFGGSCRSRSIYPRIDIACIMLITSPCKSYALLGRKKSWPIGRYSTLAGFLEVGETLEECCARETFEESGVVVDMNSISCTKSQPWPFPRSLMVGFRAMALNVVDTSGSAQGGELPKIVIDKQEMEDIQWFHRDFVARRLSGGSTALSYKPTGNEREFHIPGKASLARLLIVQWATEA